MKTHLPEGPSPHQTLRDIQDNIDAATRAVRVALYRQYYADPKLAVEAVTGACVWYDDDDLYALAEQAAEKIDDLEAIRAEGWSPTPSMQMELDRLYAAIMAFEQIAADRKLVADYADDWGTEYRIGRD